MDKSSEEYKKEMRRQTVAIVGAIIIGGGLGFLIDRPLFGALGLASFVTALLVGERICSDEPCRDGYLLKISNHDFVITVALMTMMASLFQSAEGLASSLSMGMLIVLAGLGACVSAGQSTSKKRT